ncbi:AAA family ATPase [Halobacillus kuroshimensis]|uniref:AAA family ATPase n=1 Tax=Halobacillus kuroshimensis TaxID=302481 RepID=A0ABS3DQQ1_9BACI|nr:AAA family ATPase [Halobacillus kuroshimensis]MBN8233632.1 AAA family ATPase [Halobacillus kuroshimensis]
MTALIIHNLYIHGFGKWSGFSLSFAEGRPNIITGKNEAGKSTLYHFFLYMFFGLPPKQREAYMPKQGGGLGGTITVETAEAEVVTVERFHDRHKGQAVCRTSLGVEHGEEWLRDQLNGLDRESFEAIFSFNADDLRHLETLSAESLGETLLDIGLTGSDRISRTERWLEKTVEERFKPQGRKPVINEQLHKVEDLYKKTRSLEKEEQAYLHLLEEKQQAIEEIEASGMAWREKTNDLYRTEQLLKARPALVNYHQGLEELQRREFIVFPDGGMERYRQLKEKILPLQSEKKLLTSDVEAGKEKLKALAAAYQPQRLEEAALLLKRRPESEKLDYEKERLHKETEHRQEELSKEVQSLDIPLTVDDLDDYTFPFYIEETWRELKNEEQTLVQERAYIHDQSMDLEREFQYVETKKAELEEEMIGEDEAAALQYKIQEASETAAANRATRNSGKAGRVRPNRAALFVGAVAVLLGGTALFIGGGSVVWLLLGVMLSIGLSFYASRLLQNVQPQISDSREKDVERAREKLREYETRRTEWKHVHDQWKQLNHEDIRLQEKESLAAQRRRRLEAQVTEQRSLYPFLTVLDVKHWEKLFHKVVQLREKRVEYLQAVKRIEELEREQDGMTEELKTFHRRLDWEILDHTVRTGWNELSGWIKQQEQLERDVHQQKEALEALERRLKKITYQLQGYLEECHQLFGECGVESEQDFYKRAEEAETVRKLQEDVAGYQFQIDGLLSEEDQAHADVWNQVPEESRLLTDIREIKRDIEHLETQQSKARQHLADIHSRLDQMENSDERSALTHHYQAEKEKLKEMAKEWAGYQAALQALKETKQSYQSTYLPAVLAAAEDYFRALTDRRYESIAADDPGLGITVLDSEGMLFAPGELSKGTRDQLYISLRLALGETMAGQRPLPFFMDDAFVHFDERRLQKMTTILQGVSTRHQVLFFSWRSDLQQVFTDANIQQLK